MRKFKQKYLPSFSSTDCVCNKDLTLGALVYGSGGLTGHPVLPLAVRIKETINYAKNYCSPNSMRC